MGREVEREMVGVWEMAREGVMGPLTPAAAVAAAAGCPSACVAGASGGGEADGASFLSF